MPESYHYRHVSLRQLTDDELILRYDDKANYTDARRMLLYYNEMQRRENEKQREENDKQREDIKRTNKIMKMWTVAIGIMTLVNLVFVVLTFVK